MVYDYDYEISPYDSKKSVLKQHPEFLAVLHRDQQILLKSHLSWDFDIGLVESAQTFWPEIDKIYPPDTHYESLITTTRPWWEDLRQWRRSDNEDEVYRQFIETSTEKLEEWKKNEFDQYWELFRSEIKRERKQRMKDTWNHFVDNILGLMEIPSEIVETGTEVIEDVGESIVNVSEGVEQGLTGLSDWGMYLALGAAAVAIIFLVIIFK